MVNTIKIGNKNFEVHRSKYANIESLNRYAGRKLLECYTKPSKTKTEIYNDWLKWSSDNNIQMFGVSGYNSNTFSLQGLYELDSVKYVLRITPTSNKAYIIE